MNRRRTPTIIATAVAALIAGAAAAAFAPSDIDHAKNPPALTATSSESRHTPPADSLTRYSSLSEEDFRIVADELKVEVAAIKTIVEIEAGKQMKGFYAPGVPVVNFDRSMYLRYRSKGGKADKNARIPKGLSGYALKEWTQLTNARHVNAKAADLGTFWGMFQIGGFNYSACGCKTIEEFVSRISYSEFEQLELFAKFISSGGMLEDLRKKNWAGFARKYNGAGYAKRGYHTRMASAYEKYKRQENSK